MAATPHPAWLHSAMPTAAGSVTHPPGLAQAAARREASPLRPMALAPGAMPPPAAAVQRSPSPLAPMRHAAAGVPGMAGAAVPTAPKSVQVVRLRSCSPVRPVAASPFSGQAPLLNCSPEQTLRRVIVAAPGTAAAAGAAPLKPLGSEATPSPTQRLPSPTRLRTPGGGAGSVASAFSPPAKVVVCKGAQLRSCSPPVRAARGSSPLRHCTALLQRGSAAVAATRTIRVQAMATPRPGIAPPTLVRPPAASAAALPRDSSASAVAAIEAFLVGCGTASASTSETPVAASVAAAIASIDSLVTGAGCTASRDGPVPAAAAVDVKGPACDGSGPDLMSRAVPAEAASGNKETVELFPGARVDVGSHHFHVLEQIGTGSYSTVWAADASEGRRDSTSGERRVALKDVLCKSHTALRQALFEVQLMLGLERRMLLEDSSWEVRLPRCLTYEVHANALGSSVRTAMTRLPGEQLDGWLRKASELTEAVPQPEWAAHLQRGCAMAAAMVRQIGPTLDFLSSTAWHRDVNSHNVMVSSESCGVLCPSDQNMKASFWLCDLGLAVDSHAWVAPSGEGKFGGAWRHTDIGGDCRYWPPGAWMLHCFGAEFLDEREDYCRQYRTRLDVHGLGITAIETLCSTALAGYIAAEAAAPGSGGASNSPWARLLEAWYTYRETVGMWWEMIYSVFSQSGDFGPIHAWFTQHDAPAQCIQMLESLHQALCVCIGVADPATGRLLRVLVELTHASSTMTLQEACAILDEAEAIWVAEHLRQTSNAIAEVDEAGLAEEELGRLRPTAGRRQRSPPAVQRSSRPQPRSPGAAVAAVPHAPQTADDAKRKTIARSAQSPGAQKRWEDKLSQLTSALREGRRPSAAGTEFRTTKHAVSDHSLVAAPGG